MSKEDSDSEEEILVYAEFEDSVNIDKYRAIHVLGADDKNPIIQLDETFFMGKYENALGTYMFFEEDPIVQSKDPLFDKYPEKNVKYVYKTRKFVSMEHAYVTPKEGQDSNAQSQTKEKEEDVQPVTFKDLQQATEAFKAYFKSDPNTTVNSKKQNSVSITTESTNTQNLVEITIEPTITENPDNIRTDSMKTQNLIEVSIEPSNISTESANAQNIVEINVQSTNKDNPVDQRIEPAITRNLGEVRIESTHKENHMDTHIESIKE